MTIVFVSIHIEKSPPAFPLAASILQTAVEESPGLKNCKADTREFYMLSTPSEIAGELTRSKASVFGFSVYTWNASSVIETVRLMKKQNPDLQFIAGGPQVTAVPDEFRKTGLFNLIVEGEGEAAVPAWLQNQEQTEPAIFDFEKSSSPYQRLLSEKKYKGLLWEVSRGCPYNCAFCYESRGSKSIKEIPQQRQILELKLFREKEIEKIWVLDPTFNHNKKHAEDVLQRIIKYNPEAHYTFEIRAELMNEPLCSQFSELSASLQIGLQSTDKQVLKSVNRSLDAGKFLQKCRMMSSWGLTYGIDLIYGLPFDTIKKFLKSVDYAVDAGPNNIDIFPLSVLPGTELANKIEEWELNNEGFPSYTVTGNSHFPAADLKRAAEITHGCNELYNKEQAFPWFRTVLKALKVPASVLFEKYAKKNKDKDDVIGFLSHEFNSAGKASLFGVIESFILWSRTAEAAFTNPGTTFQVQLCRRPEMLDELAETDVESFLRKHPASKLRKYQIIFDGRELYIN